MTKINLGILKQVHAPATADADTVVRVTVLKTELTAAIQDFHYYDALSHTAHLDGNSRSEYRHEAKVSQTKIERIIKTLHTMDIL